MMLFDVYQAQCRDTAVYEAEIRKQIEALGPTNKDAATYKLITDCIDYCAKGLAGEAGELANQVKKITRDDGGRMTSARREKLFSEIGGVLWYCAQLCSELGVQMSDVALENLRLLQQRKQNNTIHGDARTTE